MSPPLVVKISQQRVKQSYGPTLKNQLVESDVFIKGKIRPVLIVTMKKMYLNTRRFSKLTLISLSKAEICNTIIVEIILTPLMVIGIVYSMNFYIVKVINHSVQRS